MPKFIELIKTENKIEIINLDMFIMKSFEIRKKLYFDQYAPHAFFLYIHVVDLFICHCIYYMYNDCIYVSLLTVY